jgi:hypothetical protein
MKTSRLLVTAIFAAAMALSGGAYAHGKKSHDSQHGEKYDSDGDGHASVDEILQKRAAKFAEIDVNPTDNFISFEEFKTWIASKQADRFAKLDANSDSLISLEEYLVNRKEKKIALFTQVFKLANTNAEDDLNADEFAVLGPQLGQIIMRFASLNTNKADDGSNPLDADQISLIEYLAAPFNRHKRHH